MQIPRRPGRAGTSRNDGRGWRLLIRVGLAFGFGGVLVGPIYGFRIEPNSAKGRTGLRPAPTVLVAVACPRR